MKWLSLFAPFGIICFSLTARVAFGDPVPTAGLRFDGVYQAHPNGGSQSLYLRFYADGGVVAMSYAGPPEDVADFIGRGFSVLPQGKYKVEGQTLTFTTTAARGAVDYSGRVDADGITLHVHSRITDYASDERFLFQKVTFPDEAHSSKAGNH